MRRGRGVCGEVGGRGEWLWRSKKRRQRWRPWNRPPLQPTHTAHTYTHSGQRFTCSSCWPWQHPGGRTAHTLYKGRKWGAGPCGIKRETDARKKVWREERGESNNLGLREFWRISLASGEPAVHIKVSEQTSHMESHTGVNCSVLWCAHTRVWFGFKQVFKTWQDFKPV